MSKNSKPVYSTNPVENTAIQHQLKQLKVDERKQERREQSESQRPPKPKDGIVRIHRESKGRGGKGVCVITGLNKREDELKELAKKIKQQCGTGGTVKNDTIEIQGDQREKIKSVLESLGFTVKLAGG